VRISKIFRFVKVGEVKLGEVKLGEVKLGEVKPWKRFW
jgi:hypothetical protein